MKDIADLPAVPAIPPAPRDYRGVNWTGATTLYVKEIKRFWKVGMQTLAAPVLNALLYLLIFVVALRGVRPPVNGVPFALFIAPGLIMMSILNAAFANSSSSLMQAKMMGLTQDFLTAPLTPMEQVAAFALGAATRGVIVGVVTAAAVWPFIHFGAAHWWAVLYFGVAAALMMGLIGCAAGLWAEKFDHLAAVTTFIVMPLSMLSGTFYTVQRLPEPFQTLSHYNPFFYAIAGFRYGLDGLVDGSIWVGVLVTGGLTAAMGFACWRLFETGYRLKS
ncbi:MAG: ABC transporter permease [Caulobacteraceae bacterium]|nr:ABC transporter permease [Caulobacteraceae bacterium]